MTEREDSPFVPIIVSAILWAMFMLLHIFVIKFDWLQNLAIIVLSLIIMGCIVGLIWVFWIFKR